MFAIAYQTGLAYIISLIVYQIGMLVSAGSFHVGTVIAFAFILFILYLLFRPQPSYQKKKIA